MFFCYIILGVSLVNFLHDFDVSSCDENCADKPVFTPSRLVVKNGDSTSATCYICQHCQIRDAFGLETPQGVKDTNGTKLTWRVDSLTEFAPAVMCHYTDDNTDQQCCTTLPVTLYQPPDNASFSINSQMFEGRPNTLHCDVSNVAPIENLAVTFYRGQTALGQSQTQFNDTVKPVSRLFTLTFTPSNEDDGGQFWCEAKLELGPEGPQPPPVAKSERVTATVLYKPQLQVPSQPDQIVITEGDRLQLNCTAVGNPRPSYNWTVPPGGVSSSSSSVLSIESVTTADEGEYSCLVSNSMGSVTVVYQVEVRVSNIGYIIAAVITAAIVFAIIGWLLYRWYHKTNRTGIYKMEKQQKQPSLLPSAL